MNEYEKKEDEIDLKELFLTIVKYKKLISASTLLIVCLAVVFVFFKTPIYGVNAVVEIGSYKENNQQIQLDDLQELEKRLNVIFIDFHKKEKNEKSYIDSISALKQSNNFLEIKALGTNNELAISYIKKVTDYLDKEHTKILDEIKQRRTLKLTNLNAKIDTLKNKELVLLNKKIKIQKQNIKDYKNELFLIKKNLKRIEKKDHSLTALKLMEKRDLTNSIITLNTQLMDMINKKDNLEINVINSYNEQKTLLETQLLSHNFNNTKIVGQIMYEEAPKSPKTSLIIMVSLITGLILSIFLVFIIEFIKGIKEDEK